MITGLILVFTTLGRSFMNKFLSTYFCLSSYHWSSGVNQNLISLTVPLIKRSTTPFDSIDLPLQANPPNCWGWVQHVKSTYVPQKWCPPSLIWRVPTPWRKRHPRTLSLSIRVPIRKEYILAVPIPIRTLLKLTSISARSAIFHPRW